MRHYWPLLSLALLVLPSMASAIQLHWITGADTLSFVAAKRCVLVLSSDSTEALPAEWRLAWLADSAGIHIVAMDSLDTCDPDSAKVQGIDPPVTPADSAAFLLTANFCSDGESPTTLAYYIIEQPGGSSGRLKVVALDPTDPDANTVLESNEVTYNGGVEGDYGPVLLRAESNHATAELRVKIVGAGLDSVVSVTLGAPDYLWDVPLTIVHQDSISIEAIADVHTPLPEAVVLATTPWGASDLAWLPSEQFNTISVESAGADTILYRDPNPSVYPKDFAFHYSSVYDPSNALHPWKGYFHLFYIRNKAGLDSIIAHAWTDSLGKAWSVDTMAFRPSGRGWDAKKVWAPSIQTVGNLYYMFYTGVDSVGNQSIGYATTPMLGTTNTTWSRNLVSAYTAFNTDWADTVGHDIAGRRSFRDPFVMPDPEHTGRYLLFNTGEDRSLFPRYVIGVARNQAGTLQAWTNLGKYPATDHDHLAVPGAVESPLVVRDSLTGAWRMFVANASYDNNGYFSTIFLTQSPGDSLTNRTVGAWPDRDSLYAYLDQDADVIGWQACEHLHIGHAHFFAAYDGTGIGITRMHWDPDLQKFIIAYPSVASVGAGSVATGVRLAIAELRPGAGMVRFAIESAETITPKLTVFDVLGRRVRGLGDGRPMLGRAEVVWDCRDDSGTRLSSGVYFARLTGAREARVVRVPIIR